jgi:hypothetical protein
MFEICKSTPLLLDLEVECLDMFSKLIEPEPLDHDDQPIPIYLYTAAIAERTDTDIGDQTGRWEVTCGDLQELTAN